MKQFINSVFRTISLVISSISAAWFLVYALFSIYKVSGNSMTPYMEMEDVCLVDKFSYHFFKPKRFDVIVFERNDSGKKTVKRIVGLPNETIQISDGTIKIDGEILHLNESLTITGRAEKSIKLGRNEYFVLGDNFSFSEDSRFDSIGNVSKDSIVGKIWFRIIPTKKIGFLDDVDYYFESSEYD